MSHKFLSYQEKIIPEESSEENSDEIDEFEASNKENDKLMIASLDLIEKKKRESFVQNLRLSIKDPMLDISNKEMINETRTKIELLKINRKEVEILIEQKVKKQRKNF